MTNIFIWQSGEPLQIDKDNHNPMRGINLSNFLEKKNFKVTLISTNFNHTYKKFRFKNINKFKLIKVKKNLDIVLINSPGYKKNISIFRIIDHFLLAFNLNSFLKSVKLKPDAAFIGFPPIEPSIVFANWLKKNHIPYLFDIKDLWPEYFYERLKNKFLHLLIKSFYFIPVIYLNRSLKNSSGILANNEFFLQYILKKIKRKRKKTDSIIYLTKPLIKYKSTVYLNKIKFDKSKFNLYFCGRISQSVFDFHTVFKSLKILKNDKINYHFYIAGYGDLNVLKKIRDTHSLKKQITFLGYINKNNHSVMLKNTNLFIAPYYNKLNFSSNFSNKFVEAIQSNLLIATPLKKKISKFILENDLGLIYKEKDSTDLAYKLRNLQSRYIKFIKKNDLGLIYREKDFNDLANKIKFLRSSQSKKHKSQIESQDIKKTFDHDTNYSKISDIIKKIIKKKIKTRL